MLFNLNDKVRAQITPFGWKRYREDYKAITGKYPTCQPPEDDDGWSEWQLHTLIEHFGQYIHMGATPLPMKTVIEISAAEGLGPHWGAPTIHRAHDVLDAAGVPPGADGIDPRLVDRIKLLVRQRDELQAIVDKYPKTEDGVPVVPGMTVYVVYNCGADFIEECVVFSVSRFGVLWNRHDCHGYAGAKLTACFSTLAAAEAARKAEQQRASKQLHEFHEDK